MSAPYQRLHPRLDAALWACRHIPARFCNSTASLPNHQFWFVQFYCVTRYDQAPSEAFSSVFFLQGIASIFYESYENNEFACNDSA